MIVYVYKSNKRENMYIYVLKKEDFSMIPDELMGLFGQPKFALFFDLSKKNRLARAEIEKVKESLLREGFYLQLPPKPESLLIHQDAFID